MDVAVPLLCDNAAVTTTRTCCVSLLTQARAAVWSVSPIVFAGVAECFFIRYAPLFGRLGEGHIRAVHAQHATAIDGALEAFERPVNVLLVAHSDADAYVLSQEAGPC